MACSMALISRSFSTAGARVRNLNLPVKLVGGMTRSLAACSRISEFFRPKCSALLQLREEHRFMRQPRLVLGDQRDREYAA